VEYISPGAGKGNAGAGSKRRSFVSVPVAVATDHPVKSGFDWVAAAPPTRKHRELPFALPELAPVTSQALFLNNTEGPM